MAHTVNKWLIMDGPSHVVLHVFIQSDGISADLDNYVLLDPNTELDPVMPQRRDLTVKQIWSELSIFSARLAFNATTPWPFWTLAPGGEVNKDWRFFGGIRDNSDSPYGLDSDGKLLLSTEGLSDAAAQGGFVLWLQKLDRPNPVVPA